MEVEATQALTTVLRNGDDRPAAAREISWELTNLTEMCRKINSTYLAKQFWLQEQVLNCG